MKSFAKFSLLLLCTSMFLLACQNRETSSSSFPHSGDTSGDTSQSSTDSDSSDSSDTSSEDPIPVMSKSEVLNTLLSSPYKNRMQCDDDIALSNISAVGVDEDKLFNEELYPVPNKTSEVHVYSAKDDVGMFYGAQNNAGSLSNFINSIRNVQGIKIIEFEDITYDLKSPINVETIDDLYLVGQEHTLFLATGWQSYLKATSCKNLHINNIQFDMEHSPTVSGVISSFEEKDGYTDVTLDIPDEFDMTYQGYQLFDPTNTSNGQCSYMECYYDGVTGKYVPDPNHNLFFNSSTATSAFGVDGAVCSPGKMVVRLKHSFPYCSYKTPVIGTHVSFAFTMYQNFGLSFDNCEELFIENINVYVTGGMGVHFSAGKNIYLNRANFRNKEGSSRIMTCTADIIHSVTVENDLKITNCLLEASHDDALNIKMWYANIGEASKIKSTYLIRQGSQTPGTKFEVGDIIELIDKTTMERVKRFEIIESEKTGANYEVKVKGLDGSKVATEDTQYMVANDNKATHLYLHNCLIQNKRNRGILLQCRYSEISNCCFRNVIHGPIQILGIIDSFGEAVLPAHVTVKDNKFLNCRSTDVSIFSYGNTGHGVPGNIHHIKVMNNYFRNSYNHSIRVTAASDVEVHNNLMHSTSKTNGQFMYIKESKDTIFEHNKYIASSGTLPESILVIDGELENITDIDNTAELFN